MFIYGMCVGVNWFIPSSGLVCLSDLFGLVVGVLCVFEFGLKRNFNSTLKEIS
jgi:hypothetical protein